MNDNTFALVSIGAVLLVVFAVFLWFGYTRNGKKFLIFNAITVLLVPSVVVLLKWIGVNANIAQWVQNINVLLMVVGNIFLVFVPIFESVDTTPKKFKASKTWLNGDDKQEVYRGSRPESLARTMGTYNPAQPNDWRVG